MSSPYVQAGAIVSSTGVSFPDGASYDHGNIQAVLDIDGSYQGVVTDITPFHPLDHTWPDQPADHGELRADHIHLEITDCIMGAVSKEDESLFLHEDIPARRGSPDYHFVVVHVTPRANMPSGATEGLVGQQVALEAQKQRRTALSTTHTGCHLMALALNRSVAELWRKEAPTDSLGNPDFDKLAISSSHMDEEESHDAYRLGKSLRKSGFDVQSFLDRLDEFGTNVEEQLAQWVGRDGPVTIERESDTVDALRKWCCQLPEGIGRIPCGGTHISNLRSLHAIRIRAEVSADGKTLTVHSKPEVAQ